VFAAVAVVVEQAVGVGALDHLHEDGRELALERQQPLGKGGSRHLHSALVRGVDLEVVAESRVQPEQAQTLGAGVLA
jgi:hypothetical protein